MYRAASGMGKVLCVDSVWAVRGDGMAKGSVVWRRVLPPLATHSSSKLLTYEVAM